VSGLRGSGSHDVEVRDVFVPEERMTGTMSRPSREKGTLFRLPPFTRLAYNKVGVATGIARAGLDHFRALAQSKTPRASATSLANRPSAQLAIARGEAELRSARAFVFEAVDEVWQATLAGDEVTREQRALAQLACSNACRASVKALGYVYEEAGASANFTSNPLERCFRDVVVVPQHIMVSSQWNMAAGRVLLGLESQTIFF